uniref:Uncharacterized protein n=1 Tax=Physcomitrium patens TaxID=3218 RepID=A0A2K1KFH3_PHYPA|nr:uncharacterized protein LOC112283968 [Physcomitrium patens]PNR52534.1 hypothetical protein PHYPA_008908 [Physcomitrium patens]|eukprot:XP_024379163.1 uncharacterized protein LOC112283968 [Physcomitrella patens]
MSISDYPENPVKDYMSLCLARAAYLDCLDETELTQDEEVRVDPWTSDPSTDQPHSKHFTFFQILKRYPSTDRSWLRQFYQNRLTTLAPAGVLPEVRFEIMYRHVNMLLEGMEKFENKNDLLKAFTTIPFSYVNPLLERHDDLQQLLQRITNVLNQFAAEQAEQQRKRKRADSQVSPLPNAAPAPSAPLNSEDKKELMVDAATLFTKWQWYNAFLTILFGEEEPPPEDDEDLEGSTTTPSAASIARILPRVLIGRGALLPTDDDMFAPPLITYWILDYVEKIVKPFVYQDSDEDPYSVQVVKALVKVFKEAEKLNTPHDIILKVFARYDYYRVEPLLENFDSLQEEFMRISEEVKHQLENAAFENTVNSFLDDLEHLDHES